MQKFEYRAPRFNVDLTARFVQAHQNLAAQCYEISKQGLTLELDQPVQRGDSGKVWLTFHNRTWQISAKVVHADGNHGGFEFLYETEAERVSVAQLISTIVQSGKRTGPVLMKPTDR